MASTLSLILLTLTPFLLFSQKTLAQQAPAPSAGPANLTAILVKGGQYTTFLRLLSETQVGNQIENQLNSSTEGMTVFAPTDNAFNNLKAGALNDLSREDQVKLILYHVLPKFYNRANLQTVSNPVRTQFSDDGLNFIGQGNQLNVSTGIVETQVNNALREEFPLAVYQIDVVLLPESLFGAKPPAPASAPPPAKSAPADKTKTKAAAGPSEDSTNDSSKRNVGLGLAAGLVLACMGALS